MDDDARVELEYGVIGPRVLALVLDYGTGEASVVRSDMQEMRLPLDTSRFPSTERVGRVIYSPGLNALLCATTLGDEIVAELPSLEAAAPRAERTVVHLDQKDWRTLRDVRYAPDTIESPPEREAAEVMIRLVEAQRVILPLSSAHLTETIQWSRERLRYEVGLTILQLSRGWQMRHPLAIRTGEVQAALAHRGQRRDLRVPNVFTLEPSVALGPDVEPYRPSGGLPADFDLACRAVTAICSYFSVMLDEEGLEPDAVPGWTKRQQQMSEWLKMTEPSCSTADRHLDHFFIQDTRYEIARAASASGISNSQLMAWIEHGTPRDVPRMPSLGLFREVLRERHLNLSTRWKQSDLIDMMYLTCAAGYADHVVAEKHFTHHLGRAADRLGRDIHVHRNLRELVPHLAP